MMQGVNTHSTDFTEEAETLVCAKEAGDTPDWNQGQHQQATEFIFIILH